MHIALVAFDLDGVVANTEPLHKRAKKRIFAELGCVVDLDLDTFVGHPNSELWNIVIERCGLTLTAKELELRQYDCILQQMRDNGTPPSRGLTDLLDFLAASGVSCGICSSSDSYYVEKVLSFFDLAGRFTPVVCGDQVVHKKPAPDGYRKIINDSGLPAESILAIEDSSAGVAAAVAAGLQCIGYVNPTSGKQDLGRAFLRLHNLEDVSRWLRRNASRPDC